MMIENTKISPKTIGTWIINNTERDSGEAITHLKLQKLLYYVEAWFLANFDKPLFEISPQAWTHGPVYRPIFDKYKKYRWESLPAERNVSMSKDLTSFVRAVYDEYGQFSAKKLELMTHSEDPWKNTRGSLPLEARCETPMDKLFIRNYYAERLGKKKIEQLQN